MPSDQHSTDCLDCAEGELLRADARRMLDKVKALIPPAEASAELADAGDVLAHVLLVEGRSEYARAAVRRWRAARGCMPS